MSIISVCVEKFKKYHKSRVSTLLFYTVAAPQDPPPSSQAVDYFLEIRDYPTLERFSKDHKDSMEHLLNDDCKRRFANGSLLSIAIKGNDWVSYGWLATDKEFWIAEIDHVIDLTHTAAGMLYDFFTKETARGCGIYPLLIHHMTTLSALSNYMIYCYDHNMASRRGIEKAGGVLKAQLTHHAKDAAPFFSSHHIDLRGSKYRYWGLRYAK